MFDVCHTTTIAHCYHSTVMTLLNPGKLYNLKACFACAVVMHGTVKVSRCIGCCLKPCTVCSVVAQLSVTEGLVVLRHIISLALQNALLAQALTWKNIQMGML
eukprot:GHRR01009074.1.p5 GENE.GHRR01009074.1~~GHRR01009074.1.p5  ORF type:complete len:103 (+),score=13.92 GHRR01009074.1:1690-1998(+)